MTEMKLSDPFPREKVKQKRGQGGRAMSYISHGLVTERLNEVDPSWSSEVLHEHTYADASGRLHCEGVTLRLTVHINGEAVSRVEAGGGQWVGADAQGRPLSFANEIKNAYSDALKRAAMRFGVALEMWESLVDSEYDEDVNPDDEAVLGPATREQLADITALMRACGIEAIPHRQNFAKKYINREMGPGMTWAQADVLIRELQARQDAELATA